MKHGTSYAYQRGCRCSECREKKRSFSLGKTHISRRVRRNLMSIRRDHQKESMAREDSSRRGHRWSEEEKALAADYTLSTMEVAAATGRTYHAVESYRARNRLLEKWHALQDQQAVSS